jgi:AcrR family transcriptional regulator
MPRTLSDEARTTMLTATGELVREAGIAAFSIDELARRSGVAKTTIYRHFPDTRDLLVAALDALMPAPPTPDTGSLRGDLVAYLRSVRPTFADAGLRTVFFEIHVAASRDADLGRRLHRLLRDRAGPTRTIHEHARRRGELTVDYPTMLEVVQGPFVVRSLQRPSSIAALDLERLADRMVAALTT